VLPDAKQLPQSADLPSTTPVARGEPPSTVALAQPETKQQPSVVSQPESRAAQTGQTATPAQPSKPKQQPPASPTAPVGKGAALTQPSSAASNPAAEKTKRDSSQPTAVERFAAEVQRVASQVLDQRDYPKDAIGKDWQGTTQIEVRYAAAGYIQSIVIGESSGYPPLDETALQIARNIRLPNAPEELRSRDFAVRFPIVFRLQNP